MGRSPNCTLSPVLHCSGCARKGTRAVEEQLPLVSQTRHKTKHFPPLFLVAAVFLALTLPWLLVTTHGESALTLCTHI